MSIEHHAILMIQFLKPVMIVMIPSRVQQWSSFSTFFFKFCPLLPSGMGQNRHACGAELATTLVTIISCFPFTVVFPFLYHMNIPGL